MDVGGVWNGTADVSLTSQGDAFNITLTNSTAIDADESDDIAYDLSIVIDVPDQFILANTTVSATLSATGAGSCTDVSGVAITSVTATQAGGVGDDVVLSISPTGFDLEPECELSIDYQLYAGAAQTSGLESVSPQWQFAAINGGAFGAVESATQQIVTREGSFAAGKVHDPLLADDGTTIGSSVSGKIGTTESFIVTVENTGSGALFDIDITDTLGAGFTTLSLSENSSPASSTLSISSNLVTIDYLEPSGSVEILATAEIASCNNIDNSINVIDKLFPTTALTESALDSVVLSLDNPDVSYSVPPIVFDYSSGSPVATVNVTMTNTGDGVTDTVQLDATNLPPGTVTVTAGDWSYAANSFTYTGSLLRSGDSANFTFTISSNSCPYDPGTTETRWDIGYENACGDLFTAVPSFSSVSSSGEPSLSLSKSVPRFLDTGTSDQYNIVIGGSDFANFTSVAGTDNDIQFVDTLPASGIRSIVLTSVSDSGDGVIIRTGPTEATATSISVGASLTAGEVLVVDADLTDLPITILVDFIVDDSQASCNSGFPVNNSAVAEVLACGVTDSANAAFIPNEVVNNGDFFVDQDIIILNSANSPFETGLVDDGDGVREDGEGEFIDYQVTMNFTDIRAGANSTYTGSTYTAQLGTDEPTVLTTQTPLLTSGFLQYQFADDGGALSAAADIPGASVTFSSGNVLEIDLTFLDTLVLNTGTVNDDQLIITYTTTISDSDLNGAATRTFIQRGSVEIVNGDPNCAANSVYTAAVEPIIARAAPQISTSYTSAPSGAFVDVCEVIPVTMTATDPGSALYSDNTRIELDLGESWLFMNSAGTATGDPNTDIVYGGSIFTSGNTPAASLVNPGTVTELLRIDAATQPVDFSGGTGNATATFNLQLQPGYSSSDLDSQIEFDDNQTRFNLSSSREFLTTNTNSFPVVRQAQLDVAVSPDIVFLDDRTISWTMYVQNIGDGVAYDAIAVDILPDNYQLDAAASTGNLDDSGNEIAATDPCYTGAFGGVPTPCVVDGQTYSDINTAVWSIGNIQPGATRTIVIVATVEEQTGGSCDIDGNTPGGVTGNVAEASWGCGVTFTSSTTNSPSYQEPTVKLQALQDTTSSYCDLCDAGEIVLEVRNTGSGKLFDIEINQNIGSAGLTYVAGSTEVSFNGGAFTAFASDDPQITTVSGDTVLVWDSDTLTSNSAFDTLLAELDAASGSGTSNFKVRFRVDSPGESVDAASAADRTILLTVGYEPACGAANADTSSGDPFELPIREPDVTINKTGWNVSAGETESDTSEIVYAGTNDTVVWRLVLENSSATDVVDAEALYVRDFLASANMDMLDLCEQTATSTFGSCSFTNFSPQDEDVDTGRSSTLLSDSILNAGDTLVLYVRGTVQSLCDNAVNTAELEYGCTADASDPDNGGISGGSDTATLVTSPDSSFGNLSVTTHAVTGAGGSGTLSTTGQISFSLTNNGGNARNIIITDTLPSGFTYDPTVTPTITYLNGGGLAADLDSIDVDLTVTTAPQLELFNSTAGLGSINPQENILRNGDEVRITFGIYQTGNTDTTQDGTDREETDSSGDSLDPDLPADGLTNALSVDFNNTCSIDQTDVIDNVSINPVTPDLDIDINSANSTLTYLVSGSGESQTFDVEVTNNGDGDAIGNEIALTINIGTGWVSQGASFSSGGFSCSQSSATATVETYDCTRTTDISAASTATASLNLTVAAGALVSSPLTFGAQVEGSLRQTDGTDTTANYSLDSIDAATLGFTLTNDIQTCSENSAGASFPITADDSLVDVEIGEDCTYRLSASWFGSPGTTLSNLIFENDFVGNEDGNVGFVSQSIQTNEFTGSPTILVTDDDGDVLVYGSEEDVLWDFSNGGSGVDLPASGVTNVVLDIATRAKNDPDDSEGSSGNEIRHDLQRSNSVIVTFDALGQSFSTASEGYPSNAQRRQSARVTTPNPVVNKQLRNGTSGAFADTAMGQAGDTIEFEVSITNPAAGTATRGNWYDIVITDNLDTDYTVLDFTSDGIDNDGDGNVDGADANGEGIFDGSGSSGSTIEISSSNNAALAELSQGDSVTIRYRVTIDNTANPGDDIINTASGSGDTLTGANGSATNTASPDDETGEIIGARIYTASDTATLTVDNISSPMTGSKTIVGLSVDSDGLSPSNGSPITPATNNTSSPVNVVVGEEIQYRLSFIVPASTLNDLILQDTLPSGLTCIEADDVTLDRFDFIVNGGQPTDLVTTPTCSGTTVEWDFSASGANSIEVPNTVSEADRTVTALFIARVDNEIVNSQVAGTTSDAGVTNTDTEVSFSNNAGSQMLALDDMHARIIEPTVTVSQSISPTTGVDAGDTLTVTVVVENTSTEAVAHNVQIQDDLTGGSDLTFVVSSQAAGPGVDGRIPDTVDTSTTNAPVFEFTSIPAATRYEFTYEMTVDTSAQPAESLNNSAVVAWTSIDDATTALNAAGNIGVDGAADGMRNGAIPNAGNALNDYEANTTADITSSTPTITKTDQNSATAPSIGALKQYQVVLNLNEGTTQDLQVLDALNSGDESFVLENDATTDVSYTLNNIASINGVTTLTTTSQIEAAMTAFPADESTDNIAWNFGTVVTNTEDDETASAISPSITIDYFVRVANTTTTDAGDSSQNLISLSFNNGETGADSPTAATANPSAVTIVEPSLSTLKEVRNVTAGDSFGGAITAPIPGQLLEYRVTVTNGNSNASTAYDTNIIDQLAQGLAYSSTTSALLNGASIAGFVTTPDTTGTGNRTLTWGRGKAVSDDTLDIPANQSFVLIYQVSATNDALPAQSLGNSVVVDWTSLDGTDSNERSNTGGSQDDYETTPTTTSVTTPDNTAFDKDIIADSFGSGAAASDGTVRIGDTIDFELTLSLNNGTTDNVVVNDTLPTGMEFVSTISIDGDVSAPYTGSSPLSFTVTATPSAGASNLTWNIGDVVNDSSVNATTTDDLVIVYRVRITDGDLAAVASTTLSNSATLDYDNASGAATQLTDSVNATVIQPILTTSKDVAGGLNAGDTVAAGDTVTYEITITNTGNAPAYDVQITDVVPVGLRDGRVPVIGDVSITLQSGPTLAAVAPSAVGTFASDGQIRWDLDDGTTADTYTISNGDALIITYELTVDSDIGSGITLTNSANANSYFSFDDDDIPTGSAVNDRETFVATASDDVSLISPTPGNLSKSPNQTSATIGETITYTLTIPDVAFGAQLFDVEVTDALPSNVTFVSVAYGTGNGAGVTDVLTSSVTAGNVLTINTASGGFDIPESQQAVIDVVVQVNNTATENAGDSFQNSASYTYESVDGGADNSSGGAAVQATAVTINEPLLSIAKLGRNVSKGDPASFATFTAPNAGDILEYQVTLTESRVTSAADAFDAIITDTLPIGVSYVSASSSVTQIAATIAANNSVTDPGITGSGTVGSPFVLVWSDSGISGTANSVNIPEGQSVLMTYQVVVQDAAQPGQLLTNSASVAWSSLSESITGERSSGGGADDYSADVAAEPSVSTENTTSVAKTDANDSLGNGGDTESDYRVGDVISYTVTVNDIPEGTIDNFIVADSLPAGLSYVSSSSSIVTGANFSASISLNPAPTTSGSPEVITWNFGNLVNAGEANDNTTSDTITIDYQVLVSDSVASGNITDQTNTAQVSYDILSDAAGTSTSSFTDSATRDIDIPQPDFDSGNGASMAKTIVSTSDPSTVTPQVAIGEVVQFQLQACNVGGAPSYDTVISDQLPAQLDAGTPTIDSVFINGVDRTAAYNDIGTEFTYTGGLLTWTLDNPTDAVSDLADAPNNCVVIQYSVDVDADVGPNQSFNNSFSVADYFSKDNSEGGVRRDFAASGAVSQTLGTSNEIPTQLSKSIDGAITEATIGQSITYTLTIPGTGTISSSLRDLEIVDTLSGDVEFVSTAFNPSNVGGLGTPVALVAGNVVTISGIDVSANAQAIVDVVVRVRNTAAQNIGDSFTNTATYTYETADGGTDNNAPTGTPPVTTAITITEPALSALSKAVRNVTQGDATDFSSITPPNAGDVLEYRLSFTAASEANRSDVFDLTIVDTLGTSLTYVTGSSSVVGSVVGVAADNSIVDPTISGQVLTWSPPANDIDISVGETVFVTYQVLVDSSATSGQTISNSVVTRWSSLDGINTNERNGDDGEGGAVDDYAIDTPATVSTVVQDNTAFSKAVNNDTYVDTTSTAIDGNVRVGDVVTYELRASLNNGSTENVSIQDTLPTGLELLDVVSINGNSSAPYTDTIFTTLNPVSLPTSGATGLLTFDLGDIVNDVSANATPTDDLVILYRVKVLPDVLAVNGTTLLSNSADLNYDTDSGSNSINSTEDINVQQPILTASKAVVGSFSAGDTVTAGDTISYQITVSNTGAAPAYDLLVLDTVPAGLRDGGVPVLADVDITINGASPAAGSLAPNATGTFDDDGALSWNFNTGVANAYTLPAGQDLVVTYNLTVDSDVPPNQTLTNSAQVGDYFSIDDDDIPAGSTLAERDSFGSSALTSVDLLTPGPGDLAKVVNTTAASIGELITYTLTIPSVAVGSQLFDVEVQDQLPSEVTFVSAAYASGNGAGVADPLTTSVDGSNVLTISSASGGFDIPADQSALIDVVVRINNGATENAGVNFQNQANYSYETSDGGTDDFVGGANIQAPAVTITEPALSNFLKQGRNVTQGDPTDFSILTAPDGGDILEYRLTFIAANGANNSDLFDLTIIDTLSAGLTYQSGSSVVGGSIVGVAADNVIADPSIAAQILTWSLTASDIDIAAGETVIVTYQVQVDNSAANGQVLTNSVVSQWSSLDGTDSNERDGSEGEGGAINDYAIDSPQVVSTTVQDNTSFAKSIIADSFGSGVAATDGSVRIGDTIDYALTLSLNNGTTDNIVVADSLPAGMEFIETVSINGDSTAPYSTSGLFSFNAISTPSVGDNSLIWNIGTVVNDVSVNNTVTDDFVIVYRVRIMDDTLASAASTTLTNAANLNYNGASGPATQLDSDVDATVLQPILSLSKTATPGAGSQINANDSIQYTLSVTNTGDAPAFDIRINDRVPLGMRDNGVPTVSDVSISLLSGATLASKAPQPLGTFADDGLIQWDLDDDATADTYTLNSGDTLLITYNLKVDGDVGPGLTLTNSANVDTYFSFDDDDIPTDSTLDQREQFDASSISQVDLLSPSPGVMSKQAMPISAAVGEQVTYTFNVPETPLSAALFDVDIADSLPSGVRCDGTTSICNPRYVSGNSATGVLQSSLDANNLLTITTDDGGFDIPANTQAVIAIDVIVTDNVPAADQVGVAGTSFTNSATYTYEQANGNTANLSGGASVDAVVTVEEPNIVLSKDGDTTIDLDGSSTASFGVWAENTGDSDAHNLVLTTILAEELRDTRPNNIVIEIYDAIGGTVQRSLVEGTDFTVSYDATTGEFIIELLDTSNAVLGEDEVLRLNYDTTLNDTVADNLSDLNGLDLTNRTSATSWGSAESSNADSRAYGEPVGTGTDADGDDPHAAHSLGINAPVLSLIKRVDNLTNAISTPNADPGDLLQYSIDIINSGSLDTTVDFRDDIEALNAISVFVPGSLDLVQITPANTPNSPTNDTVISGGLYGTGLVVFNNIDVAAGQTRTISFQIRLKRPIPSSTFAYNQAEISADYLTDVLLSDSNRAEDDDDVDQGNGSSTTDDDPVVTRLPARPGLQVTKRDIDLNGGTLELGESLRYEIIVDNIGVSDAENVLLTDSIPANTTYVAGSTTLNGAPVADVNGSSPLLQGILVNSPGSPIGVVAGGLGDNTDVATVQFDVTINDGLLPGTLISNQAIVSAEGPDGPLPVTLSDDPDTGDVIGDPTRSIVGNAPYLDATKIVGAARPVMDDSVLSYSIVVSNLGNLPATGVTLSDSVPTHTEYIANSTQLNGTPVADEPDGTMPLAAVGGLTLTSEGESEGVIAAGEQVLVTFQVRVIAGTPDGTIISNQGTVRSNELPDEPTDVDGNDENGDQPTEIAVGNVASLALNKQVLDMNGGTVQPADTLQYIIAVSNIGSQASSQISVTDDLSLLAVTYLAESGVIESTPFTDSAADSDNGSFDAINDQLIALIPTLLPGEIVTVRFRVSVDNVADGTVIDNQATATDDDGNSAAGNASVSVGGATSTARLSGQVWLDPNHNDTVDPGEELQSGWLVQIFNNGVLVAETFTDENGFYEFSGLTPGPGYELRFSLNGNTGGAGETLSEEFTPVGQTIQNITLNPGDNLLNQSLPIDPSGVVYDSVRRVPVADVVLTLYFDDGTGRQEVPAACLNPGQQGQITIANGFYAFDINVGAPGCPGDNVIYEIGFEAPINFFIPGVSTIIPPQEGAIDAGACANGAGGDVIPDTSDCELTPSNDVPANGEPTTYFLRFDIDSGDSQIFNNHIPVDPILEGAVVLRKTTPKVNASRGNLVPYTITVSLASAPPFDALTGLEGIDIRDTLPPGFKYVEGSSRINGVAQAPAQVNGRDFVWDNITILRNQPAVLQMVLIVGAGVTEGEYINTAQAFNTAADVAVSNRDEATVRVVADPTFDCTDIIGKVFDDSNANGYQDEGEKPLPAVRLATARGLLVTTDNNGRFHVTCAMVPNEERGSNFIIKLDERTLPSGYRVTTENPRVIRATRGKLAKANFGATIHRVVRLDLTDAAFKESLSTGDKQNTNIQEFEESRLLLKPQWQREMSSLLSTLKQDLSVLRLVYIADGESEHLAEARLNAIKQWIENQWEKADCCYNLMIEAQIYWRKGVPKTETEMPLKNNKPVVQLKEGK